MRFIVGILMFKTILPFEFSTKTLISILLRYKGINKQANIQIEF